MMSRKGFLALIGALVLTLAVMVGAWSYSMATVTSEGTLRITSSPDALIGTPEFGVAPIMEVGRGQTGKRSFEIAVRTANPVTLGVDVSFAPPGLGHVLSIDGDGNLVVQITPSANPPVALDTYVILAQVVAQGTGFRAAIDVSIPVEVVNTPPEADPATLECAYDSSATLSIDSDIARDLDGTIVAHSVGYTGDRAQVSISGNVATYTPIKEKWTESDADTFTYTVTDNNGETATATVTVNVSVP